MVYLRSVINENKKMLFQANGIELVAYLYLTEDLGDRKFNLSQEEEISLGGYKHEIVDESVVLGIINKPLVKGLGISSNIFKLSGFYLLNKNRLKKIFFTKYNQGSISQKYFLSKIEPELKDDLKKVVALHNDPYSFLIEKIYGSDNISDEQFNDALYTILSREIDVLDIIVLEDIEKVLLKMSYNNMTSEDIVRKILGNFSNAVLKLVNDRRKGHENFKINDEYDVQDLLYIILKSLFSDMKYEDPIPKVGGQSTKIDFILRDECILIEVKMIKEKDMNEMEFIKQLKIDFESYHECQWIKKLFCFIYDPFKKTGDISNFKDLNGDRTKNGHNFNVEVILSQ
jgi:hypothetical protein